MYIVVRRTTEEVPTVPNKTLYVKEADMQLWKEAEKLSGGRVSALVADALRRYVEEEKRKQEDMNEIEVLIGPSIYTGRRVRFEGRWLVKPSPINPRAFPGDITEPNGGRKGVYYGVALTRRGNIAVYVSSTQLNHDDRLDHYESFEEAEEAGVPSDILARAAEALDPEAYVQKLDI
jgi:hypothetical protein